MSVTGKQVYRRRSPVVSHVYHLVYAAATVGAVVGGSKQIPSPNRDSRLRVCSLRPGEVMNHVEGLSLCLSAAGDHRRSHRQCQHQSSCSCNPAEGQVPQLLGLSHVPSPFDVPDSRACNPCRKPRRSPIAICEVSCDVDPAGHTSATHTFTVVLKDEQNRRERSWEKYCSPIVDVEPGKAASQD